MFNFNFSAPLEKHDSSLGWFYIVFIPDICIKEMGTDKSPRVKVIFNKKVEAHISVKSKGEDRYLVLNSSLRKKLGLQLGEIVDIEVEKENSKYGMPMPEELAVMLEQDEMANQYFHQLTPGKQRSLIYLVSSLKSTDARIRKALGVSEHLIESKGELDYKLLNEKFKEVNNRFK